MFDLFFPSMCLILSVFAYNFKSRSFVECSVNVYDVSSNQVLGLADFTRSLRMGCVYRTAGIHVCMIRNSLITYRLLAHFFPFQGNYQSEVGLSDG